MTATATPSARVLPTSGRPLAVRLPAVAVAAEMALAALLMSYTVGRQSLWFDEALTAEQVNRNLPSAVRFALTSEPMTGLYLVTLKIWGLVFGDSEAALRSFSVVLGVALIPVMYALTVRLFSTKTALVAGLLTAVSTTVVAEAQQARHYALALFLAALATLCFVRVVEIGTHKSWILYALVATLAVYAHLIALFVLAAHAVSLLALPRSRIHWRPLLLAAGCFTVALLPFGVAVLRRGGGGLDWIKPTSWGSVRSTFEMLAGGSSYLLLAALVPCAFAFRSAMRSWVRVGRGRDTWRYALLIAWLFVPVAGTVIVSFVRPLFIARYMLGALPALIVLVAVGLCAMRPWLLGVCLVGLVALNGAVLASWLGTDSTNARTGVAREDWRGAVEYVSTHAHSGDAVVLQPGRLISPWDYYATRLDVPRAAPGLKLVSPTGDVMDDQEVRSVAERHRRLWLVTSHLDGKELREVLQTFGARLDHASTERFTGLEVRRYDANPEDPDAT